MFGLVPYRRNSGLRRRDSYNDLGDLINSFFNDEFVSPLLNGVGSLRNDFSTLKADIKETDKEFIIDIEAPGVKKEEIRLDLKDDVLTVVIEKDEEVKEEKENYIRRERKYGSCSRTFYVPDIVQENIKAKYDNGILSINLPKVEEVKKESKKIEIE